MTQLRPAVKISVYFLIFLLMIVILIQIDLQNCEKNLTIIQFEFPYLCVRPIVDVSKTIPFKFEQVLSRVIQ